MIPTILIIEDEKDLRNFLKDLLLSNGYAVRASGRGVEGMQVMEKVRPNLVVLDLTLPDVTGESLCKSIKTSYPDTKVVILTAKGDKSNVIQGLNLGADDYITKPFDGAELLARINARLRQEKSQNSMLKVADLELDGETMSVRRNGKSVNLTAQEFRLLEYLMINKGKVLSRDMILNRLWMGSPDVETRVVDVYIGYLRKKIDKSYKQKLIQSVRGFGYVIKD